MRVEVRVAETSVVVLWRLTPVRASLFDAKTVPSHIDINYTKDI